MGSTCHNVSLLRNLRKIKKMECLTDQFNGPLNLSRLLQVRSAHRQQPRQVYRPLIFKLGFNSPWGDIVKNDRASVLDSTSNVAVVKLPGRRFPGSVIQGDTLFEMMDRSGEILSRSKHTDDVELAGLAEELLEDLTLRFQHYLRVAANSGFQAPVTWADRLEEHIKQIEQNEE